MSLTLDQKWEQLKDRYKVGSKHSLRVMRQEIFGLFLDLGYAEKYDYKLTGLIDRGKRGNSPGLSKDPSDWPQVGSTIDVIVVSYRDYNMEIDFKLCAD